MQRQPEISKETENQAAELIKKRLRFLKKKMVLWFLHRLKSKSMKVSRAKH